MGTFRKVEAEQAGPQALGILIPPGHRTFVILRPRATALDLLLSRETGDFLDLSHDEASAAAQAIHRALRDGASVEAVGMGDTWAVRASVGSFRFVACPRVAGQPYAPLACDSDGAEAAAGQLRDVLSPPGDREQEVYFNVRFFERPAT